MVKAGEKWKFLLTGPINKKVQKFLETKANIVFAPVGSSTEEISDLVNQQKTEALIVRGGKINQDIMTASSRLKVIVKHGVGYNNIDIQAAKALKLPVLYTPYANYESVAEHTLALIYNLTKKIHLFDQEMKTQQNWPKSKYTLSELKNKCIGLIGMGRIGHRVIQLLAPLDMQVIVYDPFVANNNLPERVEHVNDLMILVQKADIISIHCPLNENTKGMLGKEELKNMKTTAYLINTARGGIIDEIALIEVLQNGSIAGAALDTFAQEPISPKNPLLNMKNVILTPHVAGTTDESFFRMGNTAIELALKILEDKHEEIPADNKIIE
jgi:D-3-phosphoglycerate dehydrogenase